MSFDRLPIQSPKTAQIKGLVVTFVSLLSLNVRKRKKYEDLKKIKIGKIAQNDKKSKNFF